MFKSKERQTISWSTQRESNIIKAIIVLVLSVLKNKVNYNESALCCLYTTREAKHVTLIKLSFVQFIS